MKKLLLGIYIYLGTMYALCFAAWAITGNEPSALIAGLSVGVGVESIAAGLIRIYESKEQNNFEMKKEKMNNEYTEK